MHLRYGVSNSHLRQVRLTRGLNILRQERQSDILDLVEPRMSLIKGINVMLNLRHRKLPIQKRSGKYRLTIFDLPDPQKTLARRNFISETSPNLR